MPTTDQPDLIVTPELLAELKKRAGEANSTYHLARRVYRQQQRDRAAGSATQPGGNIEQKNQP